MIRITVPELHAEFQAQGVSAKEHIATKCPMCGTVQSCADLIAAGAGETVDDVERYFGFSCVGRWTNAGPVKKGVPSGRGCDWTLGGLFRLHKRVVVTDDGEEHPYFDAATPEEAQANEAKNRAR